MYSEKVGAIRLERLCRALGVAKVRESTPAEAAEWVARLRTARGKRGEVLRELTPEEQEHVRDTLILCRSFFKYWAMRYATCSRQGAGIGRMFPLFDSQELVLAEIARAEERAWDNPEDQQGVMLNVLKARRLGCSTLAQGLMTHRVTLETHLHAVTASDVPEQSSYTIGMFKLMLDELPWWLRPGLTAFSNTYPEEYELANGSHVWTHSGDSKRGALGAKGNIGRGKGVAVCHLTELATWQDTDQIDSALLPTMTPPHPRVLAVFESSPQGRGNWWHRHWKAGVSGKGYFTPVFLPWYAEPRKYRMAPPAGWAPKDSTVAHVRRCEEQGHQWLHRDVRLTRDQAFWYEHARAYYEEKDRLGDFQQEYAADPDECFQFAGRSIVRPAVLQKITDLARPLAGALEVRPLMDMREHQQEARG